MNALDLRQQTLFACGEEDYDTSLQYDSGHIQLQQMSMATSAEKERDKKLKDNTKSKSPALSVSAVSDGLHNDKEKSKKRSPQNDTVTAISAIKSEVKALKTAPPEHLQGSGQRGEDHLCVQAAPRARRNIAITALNVGVTLILQEDAGSR